MRVLPANSINFTSKNSADKNEKDNTFRNNILITAGVVSLVVGGGYANYFFAGKSFNKNIKLLEDALPKDTFIDIKKTIEKYGVFERAKVCKKMVKVIDKVKDSYDKTFEALEKIRVEMFGKKLRNRTASSFFWFK